MKTLLTDDIAQAANLLRLGQTVIFPTETVYGLGGNALDATAVAAIFAAKQRPADNPLIVHLWDFSQIDELAHSIPDYARRLIENFFPGPFTILLPKRDLIPAITTAGSDKVCLRMPAMPITLAFLQACGVPVAAPSANLSGKPSPTRWQDCLEDMDGRVAAILKGAEATYGLESTIVDGSGLVPRLLRPGAITLEALAQVVPEISSSVALPTEVTPGTKYRHYAPKATVQIFDKQNGHYPSGKHLAYIGLHQSPIAVAYSYRASNLADYAHQLFAFFRECDRRGIEVIIAEPVKLQGIGLAIMNRLQKASAS